MKKQYIPIAFTLMASSAGFAQGNDAQPMRQVQEQHPSDCCRPCCTPKPRDPVCCECYVPAWNDMQCDWGLYLTADYLYWYARDCDQTYGYRVINSGPFRTIDSASGNLSSTRDFLTPANAVNMDTKWSSGVKLGLGWNTDCDGWDVYFQWTGYWNDNSDSSSVGVFANKTPAVGGSALVPQYLIQNTTGTFFEKIKGEWDFRMNRFDLQIGKRYWLSKCFTLRPYTGIGGIWTETDYDVTAFANTSVITAADSSTLTTSGKASIENSNWGAGLLGGVQPTFQFSDCFALYGDAGMALYFGNLKEKNQQSLTQIVDSGTSSILRPLNQTIAFTYKNDYYCMTPILDLAIGLRWETYWCDQQYHFAFDLGWEHHVLFHHNHRTDFSQSFIEIDSSTGEQASAIFDVPLARETNLAMGGLVVRVRFDF
ncbi:MAG: hypothetical protein K940chlam2_00150 [Chlamydiae bacterium]|nr:hypothetical protein [Chlamydiota bacterium]